MPLSLACLRLSPLWLAVFLASPPALATDMLAVQDVAVLAATCANCHGPEGRSPGDIPSLRGLPAEHLRLRMEAFKAGSAPDATVMTRLMKGYDAAQIQALAQWFARNEPEVRR